MSAPKVAEPAHSARSTKSGKSAKGSAKAKVAASSSSSKKLPKTSKNSNPTDTPKVIGNPAIKTAVGNSRYGRILLKLSGEALAGSREFGLDADTLTYIADEVRSVRELGVEIAIVVGAGNIFRGIQGSKVGMDRATGDYMGMLGTTINALAMQDALEREGIFTRVQSAIRMEQVVEPYIRRRAVRHLEKGRVVIFASGTGNPYFTTDTAAALRAVEVEAEVLIKATKVDGIYDSDPKRNKGAKKYSKVSYIEVLSKRLEVMDSTAISLCMDNKLPIVVMNLNERGALRRLVLGENIGTQVTP